MILKDGTSAEYGDVIRWRCWDNDDLTTWTMTGLYTRRGVVYLGGGVDFGMAIGSIESPDDVIAQSEDNDPDDQGIQKIGTAIEVVRLIASLQSE